jgi:hypothetical protein
LDDELATLEVKGREASAKEQIPDAELVEEVEPEGILVRVNLRPWAAVNRDARDTERLVIAVVASARRVRGSPEKIRRRLAAAVRWCRESLPREAIPLAELSARSRPAGYPALHHSPQYRQAYRPAYRVVLRKLLPELHASGRVA